MINTNGYVTIPEADTQVTLTAKLVSDPTKTKDFTVTVLSDLEGALESSGKLFRAGFATANLDGDVNEAGWNPLAGNLPAKLSGGGATTDFGLMWDRENLYLAYKTVGNNALTVMLGGQTVSASSMVTVAGAAYTEVKIPLSSVGITLESYDVRESLLITYGDMTWAGIVEFSSLERSAVAFTDNYAGNRAEISDDKTVVKLSSDYQATTSTADRAPIMASNVQGLLSEKPAVISFDLHIEKMPVFSDVSTNHPNYASSGFAVGIATGLGKDLAFSVTNLVDGLYLVVRKSTGNAYTSYALGKEVGDTFRLQAAFDYSNGSVSFYVDDIFLCTIDGYDVNNTVDVGTNGSVVVQLYNKHVTAGENIDFTFSNVSVSNMKTADANEDLLAQLTFDSIKGNNTDTSAVYQKLNLPTVVNVDNMRQAKVTWSSSNTAVIDNSGNVFLPETDTQVTLTATLDSNNSVYKSFTVTVPALVPGGKLFRAGFTKSVNVDGAVNETAWNSLGGLLPAKLSNSDGSKTTDFGLMWDVNNLYLAYKIVENSTLTVTLGGQTVTSLIPVAGQDGYAEVRIPLASLGITLESYDVRKSLSITYGDTTWAGLVEFSSLDRSTLAFGAPSAQSTAGFSGLGGGQLVNGGKGVQLYADYTTINTSVYTRERVPVSWVGGLPGLTGTDPAVITFDLRIDKMPVSPNTNTHDPYYACNGLVVGVAAESGNDLSFGVTNLASGLHLVSRAGEGFAVQSYALGKALGETFRVQVVFDYANGSVSYYVDDVYLGTISENGYGNVSVSGSVALIMQLYNYSVKRQVAEGNDIDFTVSNVSVSKMKTAEGSILDSLTFENIKGNNTDADSVYQKLNLPTLVNVGDDGMRQAKVIWSSSNTAVIDNNGYVIIPGADTEVTLTATLVSDNTITKNITVTVESDLENALASSGKLFRAGFTQMVNVDGIVDEVAWHKLVDRLPAKLSNSDGSKVTDFGLMWDVNNLYLAYKTAGNEPLTIVLGGQTVVSVVPVVGQNGYAEVKIPLSSVGIMLDSYDVQKSLLITYGDMAWAGIVEFSSLDRSPMTLNAPVALSSAGASGLGGGNLINSSTGARIYALYQEGVELTAYKERVALTQGNLQGLTGEKPAVITFDLRIDKMPVFASANTDNTNYACNGFAVGVAVESGKDLAFGVTNLANGLNLVARAGDGQANQLYPLAKGLGETFRVQVFFDYANGSVAYYVDDVYLGSIDEFDYTNNNLSIGEDRTLIMQLYNWGNKRPSVPENDIDFTISNLSVSKMKTVEGNPLESLSFDSIKGNNTNANAVYQKLDLSTIVNVDGMRHATVIWTSSAANIIDANGNVTYPEVDTPITLRATLASDPAVYKEITVVASAPRIDATLSEEAVVVDGVANESVWSESQHLFEGASSGSMSVVWNRGMVYFMVNTQNGEELVLTFGNKTVTVDLTELTYAGITGAQIAKSGNVVEIGLPLAQLGIQLTDYNQQIKFLATLDETPVNGEIRRLRFAGNDTHVSVLDEITKTAIFGNKDLLRLDENLSLGTTFDAEFFGPLPITWSSSDSAVIENDGAIHRSSNGVYGFAVITLKVNGQDLWSERVVVLPANLTNVMPSAGIISAGYTKDAGDDAIVIDGQLLDKGWLMPIRVLDDGQRIVAEMGAQWNRDYLYLALETGTVTTFTLKVNGKSITVNDSTATGVNAEVARTGSYVELKIPMTELGLSITRYNILVPVEVTVAGSSYVGNLKLTAVDWWATGTRVVPLAVVDGKYAVLKPTNNASQQCVYEVENGWNLTDLYDPNGENRADSRIFLGFYGSDLFEGFDDRTAAIFVEMDILVRSMPEIPLELRNYYGVNEAMPTKALSWSLGTTDTATGADVINGGVVNTKDGLYVIVGAASYYPIKLNKQVGEGFRLGMAWQPDGSLTVYVDGVEVGSYKDMQIRVKAIADRSLVLNIDRHGDPAKKGTDSIDVEIANIGFGREASVDPMSMLSFDYIKGQNTSDQFITENLNLIDALNGDPLGGDPLGIFDTEVIWTSSKEAVINPTTGEVTRPATGITKVVLTATSEKTGLAKEFVLYVPGLNLSSDTNLVVIDDVNPAYNENGPQVYPDGLFTLDTGNNSLICKLENKQTVNVVRLADYDTASRINRESMTLWVSDDGINYTEITDYKLLHKGNYWYLYDFTAEGKYIKVHYTHVDGKDADFINALSNGMIIAYSETVFGGDGKTFQSTQYVLTNRTNKKQQDYAWRISKQDLGVENAPEASLRIMLNGEILFHYVDGDDVVVRVPDLESGASVTLNVLYGPADAMDISNKEAVYEVTYGTKESRDTEHMYHHITLEAGTEFFNGDVLTEDITLAFGNGVINASTDGGRTWNYWGEFSSEVRSFTGSTNPSGGWIWDHYSGRLFYQTHTRYAEGIIQKVIYSEDGGKTWIVGDTLEPDTIEGHTFTYVLSYSDGISVSSNDGAGPNVDMVYNAGGQRNAYGGFVCRIAYTTDGGMTWQYSQSLIGYGVGMDTETAVSECSIMENEDGRLMLLGRCQFSHVYQFATSYSDDFGITWSEAELSSVYATNTQPVYTYFNGAPLLNWGGNTAFGGQSYMRSPLHFAVSYDGLYTYRNIQNAFAETYMDVYNRDSFYFVTNQEVAQFKDEMLITFMASKRVNTSMFLRISDFENWFYRTKGIYDSFEHGTVRYEGWVAANGSAELVNIATDGEYAMKVNALSTMARSVPYLQNGTISLDVYVDGVSNFAFEMQPAFTPTVNKFAPVSLTVAGNKLLLADGTDTGLTLNTGWNTIVVDLGLAKTTETATVAVNGSEEVNIPVNSEVGDYVTYLMVYAEDDLIMDNILVESRLDAKIYNGKETPVETKFTQQPTNQAANVGGKISFIAEAQGENLAYQWFVKSGESWTAIAGATAATYTTETLSLANNDAIYKCVITDLYENEVESNPVTATVTCVHVWATEETTDGTHHWYKCTVTGCTEINGKDVHKGGEATCTDKAKCEVCGEAYGEKNADKHTKDAKWTITAEKHSQAYECCGKVVVAEAAHTGGTATCEDKAVCSVCNAEYGKLADHKGGEATCTDKAKCDVCGEAYGEKNADKHTKDAKWTITVDKHSQAYECCGKVVVAEAAHTGGTATCEDKAVCSVCNAEYGKLADHKGGEATCTDKAKCDVCGEAYGEKNADKHTKDAKWTTTADKHNKAYECCGKVVVAEEDHEWKNGKCEECGYEAAPGTQQKPIEIPADKETVKEEAKVEAGEEMHYELDENLSGKIITVKGEDAFVIVDGKKYEAVNGIVEVKLPTKTGKISVVIGNAGTAAGSFSISIAVPSDSADTGDNSALVLFGSLLTLSILAAGVLLIPNMRKKLMGR